MPDLKRTPLYELHEELGARMVPFAGWEMPVQYPLGVMKEHQHCRASAGLFDVSHMGQVILRAGSVGAAAAALERLVPADVAGLKEGRQRYGLFTDASGGILDDLMIARKADHLFLVVNASMAAEDIAHLTAGLPDCAVEPAPARALLALQGPEAAAVLSAVTDPGGRRFMDVWEGETPFGTLWISRSGYTGEDGFEVSVCAEHAEGLARALLADERVAPIGLGARDSLRLEAGMCLYGSDIDTGTTPVEADLAWAIGKARRTGGARAGGFSGAETILAQLADGPGRLRVGLLPEGRAPMRAGTRIFAADEGGAAIGAVTSGAFGPTLGAPVSMGYVAHAHSAIGTRLFGEVRGKRLPVTVAEMPFVVPSYRR